MLLSQVLSILTSEGHTNAKPHIIYRAINAGHIAQPKKLTPRVYLFSPENLDELRAYLPISKFPSRKRRKQKQSAS